MGKVEFRLKDWIDENGTVPNKASYYVALHSYLSETYGIKESWIITIRDWFYRRAGYLTRTGAVNLASAKYVLPTKEREAFKKYGMQTAEEFKELALWLYSSDDQIFKDICTFGHVPKPKVKVKEGEEKKL